MTAPRSSPGTVTSSYTNPMDSTDRRTLVSKPDPLFDRIFGPGHKPQDAWWKVASTASVRPESALGILAVRRMLGA